MCFDLWILDRTPSFIIPVVGQQFQFILSLGRDLVLLTWDYRTGVYSTCLLVELDSHRRDNRLNEAKADAYGRVWLGQWQKWKQSRIWRTYKCLKTAVTFLCSYSALPQRSASVVRN